MLHMMRKPKYRLSPNEVERLVKEERERLRKLRIVQVREQAKANAAVIRHQVKNEKERLLADFVDDVKNEVLAEKEEKIRKLEQKYDSTLRSIGQGHTEVLLNGDGQKVAERYHKRLDNEEKAMERYQIALEKHERDKAQEEWEASRNIRNRNLALEVESKRSEYISSLPPPASDDISFNDKPTQKKAIPMTDMKSFAATHYHIPDYQVVKAGPDEQLYNAKLQADQADQRLKQDLKEKKRSHHEQVEKARIRGNEALHKEMLKHDLSDMMKDLSLLQRKDRRRRQALVANVPNQVFVPPEQCLQERAEQQVEMERQLEEMFIDKQQKPDPSTLQTWSEFPSGDDDTNYAESEMSTLESVPLPRSEMALRDLTTKMADNQNKKAASSRKPDTVLKQLLNKIKEQKLNVALANQKQDAGSVLTNEKSRKEGDATSIASADSRASWKKSTEDIDEGSSLIDLTRQTHRMNGIDGDSKSADSGDSKSSGSKILTQNNALIEELQQRIQKIEDQKLRLSEQLHSQSEFYLELQKQQQELHNLKHGGSITDSSPQQFQFHHMTSQFSDDKNYKYHEDTLQDVSIQSKNDYQHRSSPQGTSSSLHFRDVKDLPPSVDAETRFDLTSAASRLRPVAGILKGTMNPQFELLASNGFLPSRENENIYSTQVGGKGLIAGDKDDVREVGVWKENEKSSRNVLNLVKEGGARRMIDFGGGDLKKTGALTGNLSSRSDKNDNLSKSWKPDDSRSDGNAEEDPMRQKVQDYHTRAQELHASMDESTLNRVRDYQQHILQTHQDRKQLLENVRNDIEQRRRALNNTSKFGTGGAFLMNLGNGGGANSIGIHQLPMSSLSSSYPMLSSTIDSRPALSGNRSERVLEPIKPFVADPWHGNKKQSILKPSSNFQAQFDLSKVGTSQEVRPATSSIDKIKKSLAFDDLNESNIEASPAFYKTSGGDSLNDTPASRQSQVLTDDSKLTTSEEDRGSPILQRSRSDLWDTSDKSNNSVTGSSSLNGSALVARAEERRDGFERRQEELRNQLLDIQHQKESILLRYYKGQQAIQTQQNVLRKKLLFADASNTHSSPGQSQSQLTSDTSHFLMGSDRIRTSQDNFSLQQPDWSSRLSKFQNGGNGNGGDRISGKSSGSGGESLNLTGDEYLEEISYHQVKGTDEATVPLPLPQQGVPMMTSWGSVSGNRSESGVEDERASVSLSMSEGNGYKFATPWGGYGEEEDDNDEDEIRAKERGGMNTWASVLSSSNNTTSTSLTYTQSVGGSIQGNQHVGMYDESSSVSMGDFEGMTAAATSSLPSSSQTPEHSMYHHHHPHELSTILEVDTPTATESIAGSSVRLAPSQSVQSLASQTSSIAHRYPHHQLSVDTTSSDNDNSNVVMDPFPDLPHILPVTISGASAMTSYPGESNGRHRQYNLATGGFSMAEDSAHDSSDERGDRITLTETSLGAGSTHTLESEPAESTHDTSGGFNLSQ